MYRRSLTARRELIANGLNDFLDTLITFEETGLISPIVDTIALGEGPTIEFKSSLQWDLYQNQKNADLCQPVLKTMVAFMNSDGGTLLIGVEDSGEIFGLEKDIEITRNSEDVFLNLLIWLMPR